MGNGRRKRKLPAALGPSKHRVREPLCGARPAPCGEGLDPGTSVGDVTTFAYQAGKKKKSLEPIFSVISSLKCACGVCSLRQSFMLAEGDYILNIL